MKVVDDQMGGFVAENFIDDLLGLVEQPGRESNSVPGRIGAADRTRHPGAEPHFDLRSKCVDLPQAQKVFEVPLKPLCVLLWDISLSVGTICHRRSIALCPRNGTTSPLRWAQHELRAMKDRPTGDPENAVGLGSMPARRYWGSIDSTQPVNQALFLQ